MSSGPSLEDVKKVIKALLVARQQNGLSATALGDEYRDLEGRNLNPRQFGFGSLKEFLVSLEDTVVLRPNRTGEAVFFARIDSSTAHIAKFVAQQKPQPVKRRNNIVRPTLDKRPCRDPSPPLPARLPVRISPIPQRGSIPAPLSSDPRNKWRNGATSREPEKRPTSDLSPISGSPNSSPPTFQSDACRNPSPPGRGGSHSIRDRSPSSKVRHEFNRDTPSPDGFARTLARMSESRGLRSSRRSPGRSPSPTRRSRRSPVRSPTPERRTRRGSPIRSPTPERRTRRGSPIRSPSPDRSRRERRNRPSSSRQSSVSTSTISTQTDPPVKPPEKTFNSICCQTEEMEVAKPPPAPSVGVNNVAATNEQEVDLNQLYYGASYFNPYNPTSFAIVPDPSFEEDASRPGYVYDFDSGTHKPHPPIPEWYAHGIYAGWYARNTFAQQPAVVQHQRPQPPHPLPQTPSQPQIVAPQFQPTAHPNVNPTYGQLQEARPARTIPISPSAGSSSRDPRRAARLNAVTNGICKEDKSVPRKKALSIDDYRITRKTGANENQEKPHFILEETRETSETNDYCSEFNVK